MNERQLEPRLILAALAARISEAYYYEKKFIAGGYSGSAEQQRAIIDTLEGVYYDLGITDMLKDIPR